MNEEKIVLGIESTAHTFGVGIFGDKPLGEFRDTYKGKALIPREIAEHHYSIAKDVLKKALKESNLMLKEVEAFAFSRGPGIGQALEVGSTLARYLALKLKKPLIPVNHILGHIEIGKYETNAKDPLVLFLSGGNSQIMVLKNKRYRVIGETIDMGVGNALDVFARELGYGFPGGPVLDKLYFEGKKYIPLPYTIKGMDFSFSGILTAAKKLIGKEKKEDLVYSFLHTLFSIICEATERALAQEEKKELLVIGGVAASKALREMLEKMCKERNCKLHIVSPKYSGDNGLMISYVGKKYLDFFGEERFFDYNIKINPKERIDQIEVPWDE